MAIVSISRIQHRRGMFQDFKGVSLASAELGYALDKRRLFIGNGEIVEGAIAEGNTEILTEYSPMTDLLRYQYLWRDKDALTGSLVPQVNAGWQVMRRLQERLDDRVSIKSFGVRGDGNVSPELIEEETLNIRRAMYELFLRDKFDPYPGSDEDYIGNWRVLYWPAGLYIINRPIPLLRKTLIIGDGSGRTVIMLKNPVNPSMNFVAGTSTYQKNDASETFNDYPNDVSLLDRFQFPPVPDADWTGGSGSDYLQVGWPVNDILISGVTFINDDSKFIQKGDIVKLANCTNVTFNDCEFVGSEYDCSQEALPGSSSVLPACVRITGPSGNGVEFDDKTKQISFSDCKFSKRGYGIYSKDDVIQVSVNDSIFVKLFDGVNVGEDLANVGNPYDTSTQTYLNGPKNIQVKASYFDMIRRYGCAVFSQATGNGSMFNHYERTGLPLLEDGTPVSTSLCAYDYEGVYFYSDPHPQRFGATGNYSIADTFGRPDINFNDNSLGCVGKNGLLYRIGNANMQNTTIDDSSSARLPQGAQLGGISLDPMNVDGITLTPASSPNDISIGGTNLTFDLAETNSVIIQYSIKRDNNYRIGVLKCITNATAESFGGTVAFDDEYTETGEPIGVTFNFDVILTKLNLKYSMTNGSDASFYFHVSRWFTT